MTEWEYARARFPRGLLQPQDGFRFSADALLLSAFVRPGQNSNLIDLGCGCGVVGMGVLLKNPGKAVHVRAVDKDAQMVELCGKNAAKLGLENELYPDRLDLGEKALPNETFDLAVANPPYHSRQSGRFPQKKGMLTAAFDDADKDSLSVFLSAAKKTLKNRGNICLVYRSERLQDILIRMEENRLRAKRMRFVHGQKEQESRVVLIEGVKNGAPGGCRLEPPLILYEGSRLTRQALEFCPFLACNAERGREKM